MQVMTKMGSLMGQGHEDFFAGHGDMFLSFPFLDLDGDDLMCGQGDDFCCEIAASECQMFFGEDRSVRADLTRQDQRRHLFFGLLKVLLNPA